MPADRSATLASSFQELASKAHEPAGTTSALTSTHLTFQVHLERHFRRLVNSGLLVSALHAQSLADNDIHRKPT
jgi:hypothetical protein